MKSKKLLLTLLMALVVPWAANAQTGNIDFVDSRVKNLCVYYWDTDNDKELSYAEAAAVSSLRVPGQNYSVFQANPNITSFNELQYFTKLNTIESRTFYGCTNLTSVTIPNSVTSIGAEAFYNCTSLTSITLSNAITSIGNSAFQGCKNLPSIGIPNSVTNIVSMAFYNCTGLTSIEIPSSVTSIGGYAFSGCTGLTLITVGATTPPSVGDLAFNNVNKSIPVYVPCESVNDYQTATGWSEFTDIQRNGSFICFADDNVKAICVANWDTDHDEELSYTEAAAVTELGMVFKSNSDIVFFDELQYFTGLTSIGYMAFDGCTGLTSIEIPSSVTTIGGYAFFNCTDLASIEIPSSVTTIEGYAFFGCFGLTSITVGATTPPSMGSLSLAFNNVIKTIPVYVPCESVNDYQTATGWSEFTNIVGMDCDLPSFEVMLSEYYNNSRAELEWSHDNITIAEGQSILYDCSMGTVSGEEVTWTDMGSTTAYYIGTTPYGFFKCYLPVGDYTFRTRIRIVDGNTTIATGEWYEIDEPFSIVTASEVNNYPFTFGFEGYDLDFLQGLNLSGSLENVNRFEFGTEATTDIAPHSEGSSYLCFHHDGNESHQASVVLPMFYNSSPTELAVSFWLYNNSGSSSRVVLEHSSDGENWTVERTIYGNACNNAWHRFVSKINLVGEGFTTPHVYVRLRFVCDETHPEQYFCLDDISVQPFENYKPYITDASSTVNSVTLSVIDNAYENGIGSERFEVEYRVAGTESWTTKVFSMEAPYENVVQLMVDGLEPNTNYEFRAYSKIPTGASNIVIWSEGSSIFSYWTDFVFRFVTEGNWSDAANWQDGIMPTDSDAAVIAANCYLDQEEATVHNLSFEDGKTLYVQPGYTLNATTINTTYESRNSLVIKDGGQVKSANLFYGIMEKFIKGYGAENKENSADWYLFAPPTSMNVVRELVPEGYLFDQMDIYEFIEELELEWFNYKCNDPEGCDGPEGIIPYGHVIDLQMVVTGVGYLYALQEDATLRIGDSDGNFKPTTEDCEANNWSFLSYTPGASFAGWNLIGNPFTCDAYVKDAEGNAMAYYRMNATGDRIVVAEPGTPIKPCEGVFVQATGEEQRAYFTTTTPSRGGSMDFTVSKQSSTRDGVSASATPIDRARISFSQGKGMGHLDLMADANRLYIPQSGKDMAVVCSEPAGEMPLNFEAAENGTYTLGISLNDTELVYCHLIDNLTGADVDLLATSTGSVAEYTFEAKTTDYTSRFKVVFAAKSAFEGDNANNFAFYNGSAWVVNASADATVQVIDMMGRVVVSTDVARGVSTNGIAPGVYVMRLIDGNDVKTQKIVVE